MILTFLSFVPLKAQQSKDLEGRVYSKDGDVAGTHVMNSTSKRATITDANGFFSIPAQVNDTLMFSAVQFKRKELVVTKEILLLKTVFVPLEDILNQLDEVIVRPFNLSGDVARDINKLEIGPIITASTLGLPNAYVKPPTQSQRKLYAARTWDFRGNSIRLDPLMNYFSGRTRMLNERISREAKYGLIERIKKFYADSLYIRDLKIPKSKIDDFIYFCEVDSLFKPIIDTNDKLKIWGFMRKKSLVYRENNGLE